MSRAGDDMAKFLKLYLLITGALAFIAITTPTLVVIGFFLLILPGLILSLAPTAFVWGCIYAVAYWALRIVLGQRLAAIAAAPALAVAVWAVPQPSVAWAEATIARYRLPEVKPAHAIVPKGDLRIDTASPQMDRASWQGHGYRAYACDDRCLALLFEPGVRSVTVNGLEKPAFEQVRDGTEPLLPAARTYRLLPQGRCAGDNYKPDIDGRSSQFGKTLEDNRAMSAAWKLRLTTEVCLHAEPPLAHHDLILRIGRWTTDIEGRSRNTSWSLMPAGADSVFAEIRSGAGKLLMRIFNLRTYALSVPWTIDGTGGLENFRFGWGRTLLPKHVDTSWEQPRKELDAALAVRRTPDRSNILKSVRTGLLAALNDRSLPADAPIFKTVSDYLQLLKEQGATPADLPIVRGLILDTRLDDLDGAWALIGTFADQDLNALRPAIVRKLLSLPDTVNPETQQLGAALGHWPQGAFAKLSSEERGLLADVNRRRRANGLITRLADMGAPAAPMLTGIIDNHQRALAALDRDDPALSPVERDHGYGAHRSTIAAAVAGLCRLGPAAHGQLSKLLVLEQRIKSDGFERRDWDRMMVRIGKPVDHVRMPANLSGTEGNYQHNLQEFLDRFRDADRDCQ